MDLSSSFSSSIYEKCLLQLIESFKNTQNVTEDHLISFLSLYPLNNNEKYFIFNSHSVISVQIFHWMRDILYLCQISLH